MIGRVIRIKLELMRRLWAVSHEYGLDKDMLHELCLEELGEEHISSLSDKQAKYLIGRIQGKNVQKPAPRGMITNEQKKYIKDLEQQLGWDDNPARLAGFIKKYAKTDVIDWLTVRQASKVIEGLKVMAERK